MSAAASRMTSDQHRSNDDLARFWLHLKPGDNAGCMRTGQQGIVDSKRGQLVIIDVCGWKFATQLIHIETF